MIHIGLMERACPIFDKFTVQAWFVSITCNYITHLSTLSSSGCQISVIWHSWKNLWTVA